jgi:hypothetical protein
MARSNRIKAWSYSRYSDYKQCPLKAKLKHVDRLPEPKNAAMERGSMIHKLAEDYIKGALARLPAELKPLGNEFKQLRDIYKKRKILGVAAIEDSWAFTAEWTRTTWDDWTHCWVRIKLDCAHYSPDDQDVLIITDWKTGKYRMEQQDDYREQLELYALPALLIHPHVREVQPRLGYTDLGLIWPGADNAMVFTQSDVPRLKKLWAKRTKPMLADERFAPRPGDYCRYCHFRKANGGPCQF